MAQMKVLEAFNHGNGTMTVFIREESHIEWLRSHGVQAQLTIGDVLLDNQDRQRIYQTLTEAMQPALAGYLEVLSNDWQDSIGLTGTLD